MAELSCRHPAAPRHFRAWKAFQIWRRSVRRDKFAAAQAALQRQLFWLQPSCREPLLQARRLCLEAEGLQLHALEQGQAALGLREFCKRQAGRQQACQEALQEFGAGMVQQARLACQACLDQLELQLEQLHSQELVTATTIGRRASATNHFPGHGQGATAAGSAHSAQQGGHSAGSTPAMDFTYAKMAARRSERRRLFSLVKLLELQMCDSLHALLMAAFGRALGLLQLAAGGYAGAEQRPLFSLELQLQRAAGEEGDGGWQLALVPATHEFYGAMTQALRESADAVCAVPMLAEHQRLQVGAAGGAAAASGAVRRGLPAPGAHSATAQQRGCSLLAAAEE
jgi:hypothetical protein